MAKRWIQVDSENLITQVAFLDSAEPTLLEQVHPGDWVEAGNSDDDDARYKHAHIGYFYDANLGGCHDYRPYDSWQLSEITFDYEAPVPMPEDGEYVWDEQAGDWVAADEAV